MNTIISAAFLYQSNLVDTNILFVFDTGNKQYGSFQAEFRAHHFAHLTGAVLISSEGGPPLTANRFFEKCVSRTLSMSDFELSKDNATYLKSQVILELMKICSTAKMVGEYDCSHPLLYTEKLVGNVRGCMGFLQDADSQYLVPNTLLHVSTRDIVRNVCRLMAVYQKKAGEPLYSHMLYLVKPLKWQSVTWGEEIDSLIDSVNLHFR